MPLDYETLRLLWWALLGILLIGFAVTDGFDLGTAMLLPLVGRTDLERRIVINTIGPVWEGNQVWFILGGGAIFAAWPLLYGAAFSGFYLAMLLLLAALILRPVGFKFRSKIEDTRWRSAWDAALFVGGLVPALVFGVAFGNILQGVPFQFDETLRMTYTGDLWGLFNPFALLCGLVSVTMLAMHGAAYLCCKTENPLRARAGVLGAIAALALIILFAAAGFWVMNMPFFAIESVIDPNGPSNPLLKTVGMGEGLLLRNYSVYPWTITAPALAFLGAAFTAIFITRRGAAGWVLVASGLAIAGVVATAGFSMFPFFLPSTIDARSSLTVWDASSSQATLMTMVFATALFLPIVLAYTAWVYSVLRGRVTGDSVSAEKHSY
jgi:cytochrome bd ubiquinol oxidase subunit II